MVRRGARSRRASLEAARRSGDSGSWRSGASAGGAARAIVLLATAVALLAVGFGVGRWSVRRDAGSPSIGGARAAQEAADTTGVVDDTRSPAHASEVAAAIQDALPADVPPPPALPPPEELREAAPDASPIAIVIDDLGRSVEVIDQLRAVGVALTYAVLPFETRTAEVTLRLAELGEEFLCHLPMEPERAENPGAGALTEAMSAEELRSATERALDAVGGAVGVNNHMGSALSADAVAMAAVLDVVRSRGLFFLDSRTSAASVGFSLARAAGIPAAERKVFLDDDRAPAAIHHELRRLFALANRGETAIAIGHPYPETIEALREELGKAREKGYRFVRVSELVTGGASP